MSPYIKEQLQEKIANLSKIYNGLQKLQHLSLEDIKRNLENFWAVSFGLVAGVEAVLDISQYILASKDIKTESYGSIPDKLEEAKVINVEMRKALGNMLGFRNRAIHNYRL